MVYVITGSREFPSRELVRRCILYHVTKNDVVFHGCARGVDTFAGEAAKEVGAEVRECPADWEAWGISAGCIRNGSMLRKAIELANDMPCDIQCLAFWDGKSRGTKDMLDRCASLHVVTVLYYPQGKGFDA